VELVRSSSQKEDPLNCRVYGSFADRALQVDLSTDIQPGHGCYLAAVGDRLVPNNEMTRSSR
jgi:hypothetical protein